MATSSAVGLDIKIGGKSRSVVSNALFVARALFFFAQATIEYKNLVKLKLNMTRCKHWKIQCGPVLFYFSFLYCPAAAQASLQWLKSLDDKGEVGKLRAARGKNTSQILGLRHAKVLLASGETPDDDKDPAMALSSRFKKPG